ncbi:hypothetical protein K435DRAFT_856047 [Dendrothele bispora CBS 962.96]|uniref:Uncharacterized protein n=1 Tax=Dendrothele bispora (strain CBS 962.96) TaxID=1314807 RepID=A0A4S8M9L0_DENBC|nr:hypothetical protein K435DRAFT_856047 [Dendrothele bispora CBS 962.96]
MPAHRTGQPSSRDVVRRSIPAVTTRARPNCIPRTTTVPRTLAHVPNLTPVEGNPEIVTRKSVKLIDIAKLPLHVNNRAPALAATYFIVLKMYPTLELLLTCPADRLPHSINVTRSGTLIFQCNRCNVGHARTRLNPDQRDVFEGHLAVWKQRFHQKAERRRSLKALDDMISDHNPYLFTTDQPIPTFAAASAKADPQRTWIRRSISESEQRWKAEEEEKNQRMREEEEAQEVEHLLLQEAERLGLSVGL